MSLLALIFFIAAIVLWLLAAFNAPARFNLIAAGLALAAIAIVLKLGIFP